jgi:hypothetical protein
MDPDDNIGRIRAAHAAMQQQMRTVYEQWIAQLTEIYPQLRGVLWAFGERFCRQQEFINSLPLLVIANPTTPVMERLRELGGFLGECSDLDKPDDGDEEQRATGTEGYRQRAGYTKRRKTREALLCAGVAALKANSPLRIDDVLTAAGVSSATLNNHFHTQNMFWREVYRRFLESILEDN